MRDFFARLLASFQKDIHLSVRLVAITASTLLWALFASGAFGAAVQTASLSLIAIALGPLAVLFAVVAIPGVGPPLIERLTIRPNRHRLDGWEPGHAQYPADQSGFFADLQPGRVKVKVTGFGRFVTCLMAWQGRHFLGEEDNELTTDHEEYWEVEKNKKSPDSHPLPFPEPKGRWSNVRWWLWLGYVPFSIAFWVWTRWTYWFTGAVWIGIPGYRTIRIYWFDRWEKVQDNLGNSTLVHKADWSDHYRVGDFQFGVIVPRADTQNMVEVEVRLNQICNVNNPFLVAFKTDDKWGMRLDGANINSVILYTRPRLAKEVIAAKGTDDAVLFMEHVTKETNGKAKLFGIHIVETQLLDVSPTDAKMQSELAEPARAQARLDAALLDAQAEAAPVNEVGKALRTYPEAMHIPGLEARVRTAKAAGDKGIVIMGDTQDTKPLDAAMVKLLRQLNQTSSPPALPANSGAQTP